MGLDGVEIVMGVEETFGIEIPNDVAARLVTPQLLVDYVATQVSTTPVDACLTQQLFFRLRGAFRRQVAALATDFTLDTRLSEILHKDQWPLVWAAIRRDVGNADWPATVPWPGLLKDGPHTVRQLIWHIAAQLPPPDLANGEAWTRGLIEAQVRRVIRDVLGVDDFRLSADFVKDLGVS